MDDHTWIHDVRVAEDGEGLDITIALGAEERAVPTRFNRLPGLRPPSLRLGLKTV